MSFTKDPDAVLDYSFDWSDWLATSETISSATITVETGLTLDASPHTNSVVTAWLSGGTAGETYAVSCRITSNQGRTDDRTFTVRVRQR